ncbi:hypothetical protein MNBD_ACTINO01-554 [hydrothermal vent metagenome]|uniref:Gamma-butyrobetaine hydroxylase-like N-terminal domain-containing protein n=1 Tax=hydrothermal vent metagenome TaxID=652676 RepID=A0A3B0SSW2_9ZZZZ
MEEPRSIELEDGTALVVTWHDGRVDRLSAVALREACPCASCGNLPTPRPAADPEVTRISNVGLVGAYAINLVFAPDGHSTGIYPFTLLRELGE